MVSMLDGILTPVLIATASALVVHYVITRRSESARYPPGPLCFPLLGSLPIIIWFGGKLSKLFEFCHKKYGDLFTIELGGQKIVVVSSYEVMHELLVKNADFSSNRTVRTMPHHYEEIAKHTPGMLWAPFPHWKTLRSFTINRLREEGMGKTAMEPKVVSEIDVFIGHYITPTIGKPVSINHAIPKFTYNLISEMISNTRMDYDDPQLQFLLDTMDGTISETSAAAMMKNWPILSNMLPNVKREKKYSEILLAYGKRHVDEHLTTIDTVTEPRDLIDRFLLHSKSLANSDEPVFSAGNASVLSTQLYLAGTDTTSQAIKWALLYVCLYPEVQEKIRTDIQQVAGFDRQIEYKDRLSMPYTEAFLLEVLRIANIASTALPHVYEKDITVAGKYHLKAGTELIFNMSSILHDEKIFEEPHKFNPGRYLTGDIQLKKQRTIPFGLGRRACPGEPLARMEYFLFVMTILQKYKIKIPPGSNATDEKVEDFLNCPKPYELIFTPMTSSS